MSNNKASAVLNPPRGQDPNGESKMKAPKRVSQKSKTTPAKPQAQEPEEIERAGCWLSNVWIKIGLDTEIAALLREFAKTNLSSKFATSGHAARILLGVAISNLPLMMALIEAGDREANYEKFFRSADLVEKQKARALRLGLN